MASVVGLTANWLYGQQNAGLGVYIAPGAIDRRLVPGGQFSVKPNTTTLFWVTFAGMIQSGPLVPTGKYPIASVVSGNVVTGTRSSNVDPVPQSTSSGILSITDIRPPSPFQFS